MAKLIRQCVNIHGMQFGFVPGRGMTEGIFIVRQLQEKYLGKNKQLYFIFVDLEKAFDRGASGSCAMVHENVMCGGLVS